MSGVGWGVFAEVPVEPDADEAAEWLSEELLKPKYEQAAPAEAPTWLQDLIDAINDFFSSLGGEGTAPAWSTILIVVGIAVLVVLFLIFGLPRLRRRSSLASDDIFEADDERGSAAMRRDAEAAAKAGDWSRAIAERFRTIIRSLHERTLLSSVPGSTSHDVARRAARTLPQFAAELERAAHDFDAVRYLGDPGDRERYERLRDLDTALEQARPEFASNDADAAYAGFEAPQ